MIYRQFSPGGAPTLEIALALPQDAALALHKVLGKLSLNELRAKGLSEDECGAIRDICASLY